MWFVSKAEWKRSNKINNKDLKSLNRTSITKLSKNLNTKINHSEEWFDNLLVLSRDLKSEHVILRKNYPIANRYFADYYIQEHKVAIEIDESSHDIDYDNLRDEHFKKHEIKLVRIKYNDIDHSREVIKWLKASFGCNFILAKCIEDIPNNLRSLNEKIVFINNKSIIKKVRKQDKKNKAKPFLSDRQKRVSALNKKEIKIIKMKKSLHFNQMALQALKK